MKILSATEMRTTDQRTAKDFGVASLTLMENAGQAVTSFALDNFPDARHISVLCGGGNNGGDGFVTARLLHEAGREVTVVLLGEISALKGDAAAVFRGISGISTIQVIFLRGDTDLHSGEFEELTGRTQLWIDAVVGTGIKPPLRGMAAILRDWLTPLSAPVLAVDLPSGWDADSRVFELEKNQAFRASAVVTFTAPKPAHVFGNLASGPVVVAPIGSPHEAVQSETKLSWAGSSKKIADTPRDQDSNKGRFGHVLIVGGARGTAGAPSMASLAALRTGAGLVTAAIPESILPTVARITPELMTVPLVEGGHGEISTRNLEAGFLEPILKRKTVIAIGPGLGERPEAVNFILGFLEETDQPVVIDADALNALSANPQHLQGLSREGSRTVVLTPHPGEMSRLINRPIPEIQANREQVARDFATRYLVTLVLKGARTLIAHPDGSIAVNTSGNPGMAKGGSGDILTGIVAAMLAQFPKQVGDAVNAAVYLHGLAADFAVIEQDEHTLLATDTINHLFRAFRFRPGAQNGYVWLRGFPPSSHDHPQKEK
jgi:NAD(P)H-hydrate epimerase